MSGGTTLSLSQALQLALQHHQAGQLEQAEAIYRQILAADGNCADALNNLATLLHRREQLADAIACYERALAVGPDRPEVHFNLGDAWCAVGQYDDAIASFERALRLKGDDAATHNHLGIAQQAKGQIAAAVESYHRATVLNATYAEAHNNLGAALTLAGRLDDAIECFDRAIALRPVYAEAHNNLAHAFKHGGLLDEAIAHYRRAIELRPDYHAAHSNLLYTLYLHPAYDPSAILAAHRQWEKQHAAGWIGKPMRHDNDPSPQRRLRVAYVSPDFKHHVISRFLLGPFENFEHEHFTIICFSNVQVEDQSTQQLRAYVDEWYTTTRMSDDALAEFIRAKRIDILVDLSLHHADNRMTVFARKPAPVQVCTLAYPGTTGLSAMDYRFTDAHLDPPGGDEHYAEKSARLTSYWCYRPWDVKADIGPAPVVAAGHVTFACLNNFAKVSEPALKVWAEILRAVGNSRLLLHAPAGRCRERVNRVIDPARVEFVEGLSLEKYCQAYNRIDIALDPFPCAGGTTTCDALWMGVPVVTLAGKTAVGRGGVSLLNHVGLGDLVAQTHEDYARIAAELAGNVSRLTELRTTLRPRMASSLLCDAAAFARDMENHYRSMWRHWCATR